MPAQWLPTGGAPTGDLSARHMAARPLPAGGAPAPSTCAPAVQAPSAPSQGQAQVTPVSPLGGIYYMQKTPEIFDFRCFLLVETTELESVTSRV